MSQPVLEIVPLKPAVRSDAPTTLDVLLRISAPAPALNAARPPVNLGLVLDRSGSMASAKKLDYAREAAEFAVLQLLPTDRVSITIFDDHIETIVPNDFAERKDRIVSALRGILPRNSTALHDGWKEGAKQVGGNLLKGGLNRVILLSDGLANVGETNNDVIASAVHRAARESVGTTTMGLGDDYNEDLLEAMARSGDGNYFHIEDSKQLPDIFQTELKGLMATFGRAVELGLAPQSGVHVADVLNDFEKTPQDRYKLANLVAGWPILAVVRLNVPPLAAESALVRFELKWTQPDGAARNLAVSFSLPTVPGAAWDALAANVEVEEKAALLLSARYKKQATHAIDRGNPADAKAWLEKAKAVLSAAPPTAEVNTELAALKQIEEMLADGETTKFRKHANYQAHARRSSRPYS
ncbi:MAG: VWA domain-containing protein [Gemmataceae bacterium]